MCSVSNDSRRSARLTVKKKLPGDEVATIIGHAGRLAWRGLMGIAALHPSYGLLPILLMLSSLNYSRSDANSWTDH
jgi:hypothetical protein